MESQDESGNQVPLSKEDEDHVFLQAVEASSHGRYMYGTSRNKSSSFAFDAFTSLEPLEVAHQRLESLSHHNLNCRRKYASYEVAFSHLMSEDFKPR